MEIYNNKSTGAFAWAPSVMSARGLDLRSVSPKVPVQGTGLSFAAATGIATSAHRTDDAKVPDPRGRLR